jgi:hypothetical protein
LTHYLINFSHCIAFLVHCLSVRLLLWIHLFCTIAMSVGWEVSFNFLLDRDLFRV